MTETSDSPMAGTSDSPTTGTFGGQVIVRRHAARFDDRPLAQPRIERSCRACRFGASLPQGPRGLLRCVHPGEPTCGQFLRGPVACNGFQERKPGGRPRVVPGNAHDTANATYAVCGDCHYADLHALEAACECTCPPYPMADPALRLRHCQTPACRSFIGRADFDLVLHVPEPVPATAAR